MKATLASGMAALLPSPALSMSQRMYIKGVDSSHMRKAAPARGGGRGWGGVGEGQEQTLSVCSQGVVRNKH